MPQPPAVIFGTPDGSQVTVFPGGLIGRLSHAALRIDDPYISEAHCMLSLRGRAFKLLGLRGALQAGRRPWSAEVDLREGQEVRLSETCALTVERIVLPSEVLALEGLGEGRHELDRPELSLFAEPPHVRPGALAEAAARVWCTEGRWWVQDGETSRALGAGDALTVGPHSVQVVRVPLGKSGVRPTESLAKTWPPMTLTIWPQHTEIQVEGRSKPVKLKGNAHAIVQATASLTAEGGSAHWQEVAGRIWRVNATEDNWYTNLGRLKKELRKHNLPPDLVESEGGQVRLVVREGVDGVVVREG